MAAEKPRPGANKTSCRASHQRRRVALEAHETFVTSAVEDGVSGAFLSIAVQAAAKYAKHVARAFRMNPRLVSLAGPLQGNVFPLAETEMSVGRESSNQLSIADGTLSRRHCLLVPNDGGFIIRDLKSRNGTLVNGVPVDEKFLEHGDQIWLGDSAFVYLLDQEAGHFTRSAVEFTETKDLGSLLLLRGDES